MYFRVIIKLMKKDHFDKEILNEFCLIFTMFNWNHCTSGNNGNNILNITIFNN